MTQGLGEFVGQSVQDIMHHSRLLRNLSMAGALGLGALGCGATPHQVSTDQPTMPVTSPGNSETTILETTSPSTTPTPEEESTTTAPLDIRQFDFSNFTFEANACLDESQPWPVALVDGTASRDYDNSTLTVSVADEVIYGDITADGSDEALVPLTCENSHGKQINAIQVYSLTDGDLSRLAIIGASTGAEDVQSKPEQIRVQGGQVVVDESRFTPDDPTCCPSQKARVHFYWNGTDFIESSVEILNPPASKPPVEQPVSQISVDGFSTFDIGMNQDDIEAQGYRTKVECASTLRIEGAAGQLYVRLYQNKVEAIQSSDPFYKTIAGIHADINGNGSTEQEVRNAYGSNIIATYLVDVDAGQFRTLIFESPQFTARNKQLQFVIVNGRVQGITEALKGTEPIVCL